MKHKTLRAILAVILAVCFCVSAFIPVSAAGLFGGDTGIASAWDNMIRRFFTEKTVELPKEDSETLDETGSGSTFMRIFHLDCGRIYFSVDQIKDIIDILALNDYTHLELAFGNGGLRFLLDDMSVTANGTTYASDDVKNAIQDGNTVFVQNDGHNNSNAPNTCLTESEMNEILTYANTKGIQIIPLLNTPGHMNAVVSAIGTLTGEAAGYPVNGEPANSTININKDSVVALTKALIQKYVDYFDGKCQYFNLGADEFANDPTDNQKLGFNYAMKENFIAYVNAVAAMIIVGNMTPMMFNDGYAWSDAKFNENIVVCYWTSVGGVSSTTISQTHKIINTNQKWYYVLGSPFGTSASSWCSYASATNGVNNVGVETLVDGGTAKDGNLAGAMMCLWCDYTDQTYTAAEAENVSTLLNALASNNRTYFSEAPTTSKTIYVTVNQTVTDTIEEAYSDDMVNAAALDTNIAAVTAGSKTITSLSVQEVTNSIGNPAGKQYLIENARSGQLLTATSKQTQDGTNGLQLAGEVSAYSNEIWTIGYYKGSNSNSGYAISRNNQYFDVADQTASVAPGSKVSITLTYDTTYSCWTISRNGYYLNDYGNRKGVAAGYTAGANDAGSRWNIYEVVEGDPVFGTEVVFTGNSVGTTYAVVGNVFYTIHVTAENLEEAPRLTYYPFISDYPVYESGTDNGSMGVEGVGNPQRLSATYPDVNSEQGIPLSAFVWASGDWKWEGATVETVLWKGMLHKNEGDKQIGEKSDKSLSGTEFSYVRYFGGKWSVSPDRTTWTDINLENDEVCVYYLQKTSITNEVTTYVKDWAYTTSDYGKYAGNTEHNGHKALSFAVVYPNGQLQPAEGDIYSESTLIYWADTGATNKDDTMLIRVGVNEIYEVEKITWTMGAITEESATDGKIQWHKKTMEDGSLWYDETTCWDESSETEPIIRTSDFCGYNQNTYVSNLDALLVLIYLKPIVTEDSLTVRYWDDSANTEIHSYPINIQNISGEEPGTFLNRLEQLHQNDVKPGTFPLDDGAYVENINGVNEVIEKNLTQIPALFSSKYASGLYKYISAEIDVNDSKTLILHYNLDSTNLSKSYVIDFGLPITIPASDFVENPTAITEVEVLHQPSYGLVAVNSSTRSITYTPTQTVDATDMIRVKVTFEDNTTETFTIGIIPATNVLYEENFININIPENPKGSYWTNPGTADSITQTLEKAGEKQNVYGFDTQVEDYYLGYDSPDDITYSMGNAYKAELTIPDGKDFVNTSNKLSFTFKGTGFDLISGCGANTGMLTVNVLDSNNKRVKTYVVDTYFHGDNTIMTDTTIYQVPVVRNMNLPYGTYTVTVYGSLWDTSGAVTQPENPTPEISAAVESYALKKAVSVASVDKNAIIREMLDACGMSDVSLDEVELVYMDENSILNGGTGVVDETSSVAPVAEVFSMNNASILADDSTATTASAVVWVDAFRVYNPLGTAEVQAYTDDKEAGVSYSSLYDYVKANKDSVVQEDNAVMYIEYNGSLDIAQIASYKNWGPENEIYLAPGTGIAFGLNTAGTDAIVQISAKVVNGEPTIQIGEDPSITLNATEMYYDLKLENRIQSDSSGNPYVVIRNTSEDTNAVLAISGLKLKNATTDAISETTKVEILKSFTAKSSEGFEPTVFEVSVPQTARKNRNFAFSVSASANDVQSVTIQMVSKDDNDVNGEIFTLTPSNTKAVASGFTSNYSYSKVYKVKEAGTYTFAITAYGEGGSKTITKTVVVK